MDENLGDVIAPNTLRIERLLAATPERVWAHLVEPEKRIRWFCGGDRIPDTVGASFEMRFNHFRITDEKPPAKYARFDGSQPDLVGVERVLEFDPPRRLRITFTGETVSEVTFELTPEGVSTRLVITHKKLPNRAEMLNVGGGWNSHLGILEDELAGQKHRAFWSEHARIAAALELKIPQ
jgi:uncharacterized protein YndB with AHSA1/START domain